MKTSDIDGDDKTLIASCIYNTHNRYHPSYNEHYAECHLNVNYYIFDLMMV